MVQLGIVQGQQAAGGEYISKDQIRKDAMQFWFGSHLLGVGAGGGRVCSDKKTFCFVGARQQVKKMYIKCTILCFSLALLQK